MRKRKWWIVVGVLLLLTAYEVFTFSKPAPRPDFLAKFRNQTVYEDYHWADDLMGQGIFTVGSIRIDASPMDVALALADEVGDENVHLSKNTVSGRKGNLNIYLHCLVDKGKPCTGIFFNYWHSYGWPQKQVGKYAPQWLDRLYGKDLKKPNFGAGSRMDLKIDMEKLRDIRPSLMLSPDILRSRYQQKEEAEMERRGREASSKRDEAEEPVKPE